MSRIVRGGLIQATLCEPATSPVAKDQEGDDRQARGPDRRGRRRGAPGRLPAGAVLRSLLLRRTATQWYELTERVPDGPTTKLMAEIASKHDIVLIVPVYEEETTRRLLQHGGRDRRRRQLPRQVPQDAHPALSARLLGEVLLPPRQPRLSGLRHAGGEGRRLHLLRPPFSRRGALPGLERGGDRLQSLGDRGRALRVPLEARAAGARRRQRLFRRRDQSARLGRALADRRVLRPELLLRPARPDPGRRQPRHATTSSSPTWTST